DRVAAFAQAQLARQLGDRRHAQAELAAIADALPAREVVADAARGIERRRHHRVRSAHANVTIAARPARPYGQLRAFFAHRAVADEQAHEVALMISVAA